ncbi:MAG TPA: LysM peptidoglycan-binding domain-containing protein [Allosphingosinicella sp.]|nr:LysM peptidoglycan-binding domain-containing protein [Allosphingosinicella sp.]
MGAFSLAAVALSLLGSAAPRACGDSYTVARHDTLYSIARRCGLGVGAIARANRIDPTRIAAGQRLFLPGGNESGSRIYRFRHGDTLYSLARWARVDLGALLAANPRIDPHDIDAGAAIRLPAGAVRPEPARLRERGSPHAGRELPRVLIAPPPPQVRPPPPPQPPRAAPPPPPRDDGVDDEEGKPDAGPDSGSEDDEPEGL